MVQTVNIIIAERQQSNRKLTQCPQWRQEGEWYVNIGSS